MLKPKSIHIHKHNQEISCVFRERSQAKINILLHKQPPTAIEKGSKIAETGSQVTGTGSQLDKLMWS